MGFRLAGCFTDFGSTILVMSADSFFSKFFIGISSYSTNWISALVNSGIQFVRRSNARRVVNMNIGTTLLARGVPERVELAGAARLRTYVLEDGHVVPIP